MTEQLNWTDYRWLSGKESACQCRRHRFNPWVGKIPWRRKWQPTPVFLPGESPWTEEPGMLQSMGSQRVGYNWVTKHSTSSNTAILTEDTKLLFTDVSVIYWCVQTTPRLSGLGQQSFHLFKILPIVVAPPLFHTLPQPATVYVSLSGLSMWSLQQMNQILTRWVWALKNMKVESSMLP